MEGNRAAGGAPALQFELQPRACEPSDVENCHEHLRPRAAVSIPLELMDGPTADLLRRLAENGLVVPSARASRVLYPRASEPTLPTKEALLKLIWAKTSECSKSV